MASTSSSPVEICSAASNSARSWGPGHLRSPGLDRPRRPAELAAAAIDHFGRLDLVVDNAAIDHTRDLLHVPIAEVGHVFEINPVAAIVVLQECAKPTAARWSHHQHHLAGGLDRHAYHGDLRGRRRRALGIDEGRRGRAGPQNIRTDLRRRRTACCIVVTAESRIRLRGTGRLPNGGTGPAGR